MTTLLRSSISRSNFSSSWKGDSPDFRLDEERIACLEPDELTSHLPSYFKEGSIFDTLIRLESEVAYVGDSIQNSTVYCLLVGDRLTRTAPVAFRGSFTFHYDLTSNVKSVFWRLHVFQFPVSTQRSSLDAAGVRRSR